jgi:hypothetical protein
VFISAEFDWLMSVLIFCHFIPGILMRKSLDSSQLTLPDFRASLTFCFQQKISNSNPNLPPFKPSYPFDPWEEVSLRFQSSSFLLFLFFFNTFVCTPFNCILNFALL